MRDWGKLPYPKFLETTAAKVLHKNAAVWEGMCYFARRSKAANEKNGRSDDVMARATMSHDLSGLFGAELEFCAEGRRFVVADVLTARNPDGSFHHTTLNLLELKGAD